MDERRWLAWWAGGAVTAEWLAPRYAESRLDEDDLRARAAALTEVRSPRLVPVCGLAATADAWWLLAEAPPSDQRGVALSQLRALCELSAAQTAAIARGAVHAVLDLHAAGAAHGSLSASEFLVGGDGRLRLRGWGRELLLAPESRGSLASADLRAVRELAAALVAGVRLTRRWTEEQRDETLSSLDESTEGLSGAALGTALDAWSTNFCGTVLGLPDEPERVRVELAALVRAIPADPETTPRERTAPRRRRGRDPVPPASGAPRQAADRSWVWKSLAALCALALVVGLEVGLLGNRIVDDLRTLRAPSPATAASARSGPTPLPTLGAPPSGMLASLTARALHPCNPGQRCTVALVVHLRAQPRAVRLAWRVLAEDLCTHRRRTLPGGTLVVPAHATTARALRGVTLPRGRGLAVAAETTTPVRAASASIAAPARPAVC